MTITMTESRLDSNFQGANQCYRQQFWKQHLSHSQSLLFRCIYKYKCLKNIVANYPQATIEVCISSDTLERRPLIMYQVSIRCYRHLLLCWWSCIYRSYSNLPSHERASNMVVHPTSRVEKCKPNITLQSVLS